MTTQDMVAMRAASHDYVQPAPPYAFGRQLFKAGRPVTDCRNDDERSGWYAAQGDGQFFERSLKEVKYAS